MSKDKSEIVTRVQEGEQSVEDGHQKIDVRRRNIIAASLASGPVIMTITARPAGAGYLNSMHGSCTMHPCGNQGQGQGQGNQGQGNQGQGNQGQGSQK